MKKLILKSFSSLTLLVCLTTGILCGCGSSDENNNNQTETTTYIEETVDDEDDFDDVESSVFTEEAVVFDTEDLNGNAVNQSVFKDYDLTMVNIWDTKCQPCIETMSELNVVYNMLPDKTNLISVCLDADTEEDETKKIVEDSGVEFTVLKNSDSLNESLTSAVLVTPTTLFFDSEGKLVGDAIEGLPTGEGSYSDVYINIIENRLESINE